MLQDYRSLLNAVAQIVFDKKGSNILALDLRGKSSITDFVIIAEGNVDRHVVAIANAIKETLSELGMRPSHVEGLQTGDWVVLDYLGVMVHLFMPGLRDKYQLEKLWCEGEIIDLQIETEKVAIK